MKLPIPFRSYQICAAAALAVLLGGCGQSGALYMPKIPPASATQPAQAAPVATNVVTSDTK